MTKEYAEALTECLCTINISSVHVFKVCGKPAIAGMFVGSSRMVLGYYCLEHWKSHQNKEQVEMLDERFNHLL